MEDSLKTKIIIKSVTKIAQKEGIPVFVVKKGDPDSGIILIKIDLLNGKGQLISCLLYTSPSPRDRFLSRMPSSA